MKIAVYEQGISGGSDNASLSECRRCGQVPCIGGSCVSASRRWWSQIGQRRAKEMRLFTGTPARRPINASVTTRPPDQKLEKPDEKAKECARFACHEHAKRPTRSNSSPKSHAVHPCKVLITCWRPPKVDNSALRRLNKRRGQLRSSGGCPSKARP